MGSFDYVKCEYPLGIRNQIEIQFQTKDTPSQCLDMYVIDRDGFLYRECYDIVDSSCKNVEPITLSSIRGMLSRKNKRLEKQESFTGEICFYWNDYEFSAYFVRGALKHIENLTKL